MMNRKSQRNPAFPDLRLSRYGSLRIIGLATVVLMAIAIRAFVPGAVSAQDSFPNPFGTPLSPGDSSGQDADLELTATLKKLTSRTAELQLTVTLPAGFYIYSTDPSFGGGTTIGATSSTSQVPGPRVPEKQEPRMSSPRSPDLAPPLPSVTRRARPLRWSRGSRIG